jgi:D-3-phosphoglycerate dehydrogenase
MRRSKKLPHTVAILGARFGDLAMEAKLLSAVGACLVESHGLNEADVLSGARTAEVILCGGAPKISKNVIRQLPNLRAVVRYGIGVDTVDLAECTRRGIYVANVPDYCVEEVATHTLSLILAWTRKLSLAHASILAGEWSLAPVKPLQSPEDLVLGLLGFGRIAQSLCRMARGVGFQVWVSDPYVVNSRIRRKGAQSVTRARLIRAADFISLHLPLTPETRHIIDRQSLKAMKPTAYLINTARGELVDEESLQQALKEGWIAGAALDVLEEEPPRSDYRLRLMSNVILTPHSAWYTERSQRTLRQKACAEVVRVLRGQIPKNLVNKEVLAMPSRPDLSLCDMPEKAE